MNEQHRNLSEVVVQITIGVGLGAVVGLVMSVVSNGFVGMVETLTMFRDDMSIPFELFAGYSFNLAPLGALLVAACLILIVRHMFGITRWHGPADSIFAAHRTDNDLDVRAGLGSTLAAFISASGGASVGQYGPLVHFGATVGGILRRMTGDRMTTDVFIGCGVAGAIAAGFNAPIAGIVFAHEAILRHFSMRAIVPISIASLSSVWFSEQLFGASTLFSLSERNYRLFRALSSGPDLWVAVWDHRCWFHVSGPDKCFYGGWVWMGAMAFVPNSCCYNRPCWGLCSRGARSGNGTSW